MEPETKLLTEISSVITRGFESIDDKMQKNIEFLRVEIREATKPERILGFPQTEHVVMHTKTNEMCESFSKIRIGILTFLVGTLILSGMILILNILSKSNASDIVDTKTKNNQIVEQIQNK